MTDDDLELRLRRALAARAGQITPDRLSPAEAPGRAERAVRTRRGLAGAPERAGRARRWLAPGLAGAAAMAVLFAVLMLQKPESEPVRPAVPPVSPTQIAPSPSVEPSPTPAKPIPPGPRDETPGVAPQPELPPTPGQPRATPTG